MNKNRERLGYINIKGKQYSIYKGINTLGRNQNAVININDKNVSQHHAIITSIDQDNHYISDINSLNGTLLNKIKLKPFDLYKLKSNDEVNFGILSGKFQVAIGKDIAVCSEVPAAFSDHFYIQNTQPVTDHTYIAPNGNIHDLETQVIIQPTQNIHELATQIVDINSFPQNVSDLDTQVICLDDKSNIYEKETQVVNKDEILLNNQNKEVEESVLNEDSNESIVFLNEPTTSKVTVEIHSNVDNKLNASLSNNRCNTEDSCSTVNVDKHINPENDSDITDDELDVVNKEKICKNPLQLESLEKVNELEENDEVFHVANSTNNRKNPRIVDSTSNSSSSAKTVADSDETNEILPVNKINRKNPRILESSISSVENQVEDFDSDETDDELFMVNVRTSNNNSKITDSESPVLNNEKTNPNNSIIIDSQHTDVEDEIIGVEASKCNLIDSTEGILSEKDEKFEDRQSIVVNDSDFILATQDFQTKDLNNDNNKSPRHSVDVIETSFVPPTPYKAVSNKNTIDLSKNESQDSFRLRLSDVSDSMLNETTNISVNNKNNDADDIYILPTQKCDNEQQKDRENLENDDVFLLPTQKVVQSDENDIYLQATQKIDNPVAHLSENKDNDDIFLQATQKFSENEDQIYLQPTQRINIDEETFKKPINVNTISNNCQNNKETCENDVYEKETQVFHEINDERIDINTNLNVNEDVYNQATQKCEDATQEIINISNRSKENETAESDRPVNPLCSVFYEKNTETDSQNSDTVICNSEDKKLTTSINKDISLEFDNERKVARKSKRNDLHNDNEEILINETRRSKRTKNKDQSIIELDKNRVNDASFSRKVSEIHERVDETKDKPNTSKNVEKSNIIETRRNKNQDKNNPDKYKTINESSPIKKTSEIVEKMKVAEKSKAITTRKSKRIEAQNSECSDEEQNSISETRKSKRIKNEDKIDSSSNKFVEKNEISTRNRKKIEEHPPNNKSTSIKNLSIDIEPVAVKLNHKYRKNMTMVQSEDSEVLSPSNKVNITDLQTTKSTKQAASVSNETAVTRTRSKRLNSDSNNISEISNAGISTRSKRLSSTSSSTSEILNSETNSRTKKSKSDSNQKMEESNKKEIKKVIPIPSTTESPPRKRILSYGGDSTPSKLKRLNRTISSPTSSMVRRTVKPKVVFTMLEDPKLETIIRQMGGKIVDNIEECTVLVTDSVKRSKKLLTAIGHAKPICGPQWILNSKKANEFLDPWDHVICDKEAETKWKFSLYESLLRSADTKLLEGYTFQIITNSLTENAVDILKGAIKSCGGKIVARLPIKSANNSFIIAAKENKNITKKNSNVKIIEAEAIFDGVLRQEIRFERHFLS